jgi:Zn-dependent protease/Tfp pilus assembly protein PilF
MDSLWLLLVWICLWFALRYSLNIGFFMKTRFGYINGSIVEVDRVPSYIRDLLAIPADRLRLLGFEDCGYLEIEPFTRRNSSLEWMQLLRDPSGNHIATVSLRYPVAAKDPFSITFYTWFRDRHLLMTVDRSAHGIIDSLANTSLRDCRINNLERQWAYHQQEFAAIVDRDVVTNLDLAEFLDYYLPHFRSYIDRLVERKIFIAESNGTEFRFGLNGAFRHTDRVIRQAPKAQPLPNAIVLPPEIIIHNTRVLDNQKPFSKKSKLYLLLISILAFIILTFPTMGWQFGIQILAIIFVHELGHLLAMQCFGYRDTSMLFIPLLGGVAMGKKENASLSQKFWVLMLGPLPGIIIGTIISLYYPSSNSELHKFGLLTIGINLFNLFPIYPLDGGKIVDLLLQPYPYLGFGLKLICVAILMLLGFSSPIFFAIAGIIIISLKLDLYTAQTISKLSRCNDPVELERDKWLYWVASQLEPNSLSILKPAQQKLFFTRLWDWHLDRHNSIFSRWGLVFIYGVSLIIAMTTEVMLSASDKSRKTTQKQESVDVWMKKGSRDYQARNLKGAIADYTLAIKLDSKAKNAYFERGFAEYDLGEYIKAIDDYTKAIELDRKYVNAYFERGLAEYKLGNNIRAILDYNEAIFLSPNYADAYFHRSLAQYRSGYKIQGDADYQRAVELNPKYATYRNRFRSNQPLPL